MQIESIFSVQTLFIALGIGVIVQLIKNIFEAKWPNLSLNKNWNHIVVPTLAVIIGMGLSLFTGILPVFLVTGTISDRLTLGCVCGFFSSYIFRGANALLHKELDIPPSIYPDVDALPPPAKLPTFPENKDIK